MKTEAIIFPEPDQITFGEVEVADPAPGDAVVRVTRTVLSTGTDTRVLRGGDPQSPFPLVPGYSSVGIVEELVGNCGGVQEGDVVFAGAPKALVGIGRQWGAQARHCVKPAAALLPLDEGRPQEEYVFTKVAAIALHGVRRTCTGPGDRVVVIGQGLIGQLHARIQAAMGRQVAAADILPWRLERSAAGAVRHVINAEEEDVEEAVRDLWPEGVQAAVEASSRQEGIDLCARLLHERPWDEDGPLPVLLVQSSIHGRISVDCRELFMKEYVLLNSRDTVSRDLAGAAAMIRCGSLRVGDLITLRARPEDAGEAIRELLENPDRHMTVVFEW